MANYPQPKMSVSKTQKEKLARRVVPRARKYYIDNIESVCLMESGVGGMVKRPTKSTYTRKEKDLYISACNLRTMRKQEHKTK